MDHYSLILASSSPRRKELLGWLNVPFRVVASQVEEVSPYTRPHQVVMDLAKLKGRSVYEELKKEPGLGSSFFPVVVGSDTLVALNDQILGKPGNAEEAKKMLQSLSGKVHQVYTGVHLGVLDPVSRQYREDIFFSTTEVEFAPISRDLMDIYVESGDPLDKAGAYGIQGQALSFIKGIRGCYANVVGFPLYEFLERLKSLIGFEADQEGEWRKVFGNV